MKMTFFGAVGLLIIYLVYKDNRNQINEHIQSKIKKKEIKAYQKELAKQKDSSETIKETVLKEGDKVQVALYWQQQEILEMVRKIYGEEDHLVCKSCGHALEEPSNFCPFCGANQRRKIND